MPGLSPGARQIFALATTCRWFDKLTMSGCTFKPARPEPVEGLTVQKLDAHPLDGVIMRMPSREALDHLGTSQQLLYVGNRVWVPGQIVFGLLGL